MIGGSASAVTLFEFRARAVTLFEFRARAVTLFECSGQTDNGVADKLHLSLSFARVR